jgi:hypothetical protein
MMRSVYCAVVLSILLLISAAAHATSGELLSFQGLGNEQSVSNFYNGAGLSSTPNYGITFSSNFLGLLPIANTAGYPTGSGSFMPTPTSGPAIFICPGGIAADCSSGSSTGVMNIASGFSKGIDFFYAAGATETVTLWSGANGSGTVLLTISLSPNSCSSSSNVCVYQWSQIGKNFSGTAYSVTFSGPGDQFGLADITLGSSTTAIPEPSSFYLLASGLAVITFGGIRRLIIA